MGVKKIELSCGSDLQGSLPLVSKVTPRPVSAEVIRACRDELAAFNLGINVSGLDEKELYIALGIDAGQWSRMRKGEAHFPRNKTLALWDLEGNNIELEYLAWRRGMGLVMLETEAERQLREEREKNADLTRENTLLRGLVQGKA